LNKEGQCQFFSYDFDEKACWLSSADYDSDYNMGWKVVDTPDGCPLFKRHKNYDMPGDNLDDMPIDDDLSENDCQDKCYKEKECDVYVYEPDTKKCWLKSGNRDNANITTGVIMTG